MEGLSFPEAIERVAEISGVPLPEPVDDKQYVRNKKRKSEKKKLADQVIALNVKALEFWESELAKRNAKAKAAREYLAQHQKEWNGTKYAVFNPNDMPLHMLPVIYGFNNGGSRDFLSATLIAEDGTPLPRP